MRKEAPSRHEPNLPKPNGFPTVEAERQLQIDFLFRTKTELSDLLRLTVPEWKPTDNQKDLLLAILYGIKFYDYVTGGAILSGFTICNEKANKFRSIHLRHQNPVTPEDLPVAPSSLCDWPISLIRGKGEPSCYQNGIIEIEVDAMPDEKSRGARLFYSKPSVYQQFAHFLTRQSALLKSPYVYPSTYFHEHILTGIEEAQHSHLMSLRKINYKAHDSQPPLRDYQSRQSLVARKPFCDHFVAKYNSLLGDEFAAHIVQAEYVRRYFPKHLRDNFQLYDAFVRRQRQEQTRKS